MKKQNQNEPQRVLFFSVGPGIECLNVNIEFYKKLIENSLNEWSSIFPGKSLTLPELQSCLDLQLKVNLSVVENLIQEKLIQDADVKIGGMQISKDKLKEMVELPDTFKFILSLDAFKTTPPSTTVTFKTSGVQWIFYSVQDNTVLIDEIALENYKDERFREYAVLSEEIDRLNQVLPLCKALNFIALNNPGLHLFQLEIENLVQLNEKMAFEPHPLFIRSGSMIGYMPIQTVNPTHPSNENNGSKAKIDTSQMTPQEAAGSVISRWAQNKLQ